MSGAFESSALFTHETMGDVPFYPDTKVTLAFGDDVFPVLVAKLGSDSVDILLAALQAATRLLPSPLHGVKAVAAGAVEQFAVLCAHEDVGVRRRAARALEVIFATPQAKEAFVAGSHLEAFKAVLQDTDVEVQLSALRAVDVLGSTVPWPDSLQRAGYVAALIALMRAQENVDVIALCLRALVRVVNCGSPGQAEAVGACAVIPTLIEYFAPMYGGKVKEEAARVLGLLCYLPEAKAACVAAGGVAALCTLMADRAPTVRSEAVGVAMAILVDNAAKDEFARVGLKPLVQLLSDPVKIVRLNALRAVSAVAASPAARATVARMGGVEEVRRLAASSDAFEAEVARKTLSVVEWVA